MANLKASDNPFPSILIEEATEPAAPAAGHQRLYVDSTTHVLMITNSSGTQSAVGGASGAVATDAIWDAAGDLALGTGADAAARLAIGATRLLLKSNGTTASWAFPTFIGARAYKAAAQSISNNSTTAIAYDTEEYDTDSIHSGGTFTIPTGMGGKWRLNGFGLFTGNTTGIRQGSWQKSGATISFNDRKSGSAGPTDYLPIGVDVTVVLAAGDAVTFTVYQNSGGALNFGDGTPYCAWAEVTFMGL